MILLISSKNTLVERFVRALPGSATFIHLAAPAEMPATLKSLAESGTGPVLILVDAEERPPLVAECRQMCQTTSQEAVPIIAIIGRPDDRQAVLAAGADDYLLLPLLPAEIQARLVHFIRSPVQSLNIWIEAFYQMNKGLSASHVLNQSLEKLARTFGASAGWLYIFETTEGLNLLNSYNLPPLLDENPSILSDEAKFCLKDHREVDFTRPRIIPASRLIEAEPADTNGLTHYLSIPLHSYQHPIGLLILIYPDVPDISRVDQQVLTTLGQNMGVLLEIFCLQREAQIYATQNAFMVLIARTINERLDQSAILSLSLEQAVPIMNAYRGDIWLLANDGKWLDLASSVSDVPSGRQITRRAVGQGLIGWVAAEGLPLRVNHGLAKDHRFDPDVDLIRGKANYSLLAVPLRHRDKSIGVFAVYNKGNLRFTEPDTVLLEGIAGLTAAAIANARLMQELRDYADQQRALYEMSQQIAAGLDLEGTLNRVLQWIGHLSGVEVGLLWLIEKATAAEGQAEERLRLVATLGIDLPGKQPVEISLEQGLVGWVVRTGQTAMVNDLSRDSRFDHTISDLLKIAPRNAIGVPMIYHDQIIGAISLLNKQEGVFGEVDLTLLSTAIEMVAVAVGNARLHTKTVTLLEERERLHQKILQAERLATVGRLTASLSHEINNPMQTIRAALVLAKEELNNPRELDNYIDMSLAESERVVQLVSRMSQIYRPQTETMESLDVGRLLHEAVAVARKELKRRRVVLETHIAPELPALTAVSNQLHLVFLNLILNLSDAIGAAGGGKLQLRATALSQTLRIEFATDVPVAAILNWAHIFQSDPVQNGEPLKPMDEELSFDLSLSHDIVVTHGGSISLTQQDQQTTCRIELPLSPPIEA